MSLKSWLEIVENLAPLILAATPLAPLTPYVILGIKTAEQIPGATGPQKLALAVQISTTAAAGVNAQAGKPVIDPDAVGNLLSHSISAVVDATNVKAKAKAK